MKNIAKALVELAHEDGVVADVVRDLRMLDDAFTSNPTLLRDLAETTIPLKDRQEAIKKAFGKTIHPFVTHSVLILQKRELLNDFSSFVETVAKDARKIAEHYDVNVTSAVALEESERKKLLQALKKRFGGTHELREHVDTEILGGLVVEIGDRRYDASIKGKLERLNHALTA